MIKTEKDENRVIVQVQQNPQQQHQPKTINAGTKLILIHQPNGQLLAVPASQLNGSGSIKIPPRASSAPPTEPFIKSLSHPTRPASVDAVGILRGTTGSQSNSLRGQLSATVVRVFNNGNMEIMGQKKLTLNNGNEHVRLRGIIRPEDISANNIIQSSGIRV